MKTEINRRTGKYGPSIGVQRRNHLEETLASIEIATRTPREQELGPRMYAVEIFKKSQNIEDVYNAIQERYNKPNKREIYSKDIVISWIEEYKRNQLSNNIKGNTPGDDDDAR